ncbi:MAG: TonB-dependent receptor [Bernardetiaceae bacterium]|jgi:hypothetical protein|nr:TonB-dependent receptor [Bernardetiaceae bacterium]
MWTRIGLLFWALLGLAQGGWGQTTLRGQVRDSLGTPLVGANVVLSGPNGAALKAIATDTAGRFVLAGLPAGRLGLRVSYTGYQTLVQTLTLTPGQTRELALVLRTEVRLLGKVEVRERRERRGEVSTLELNPLTLRNIPTGFGDFNQMLSLVGLGIVNNNELSTAYAVRGGSFEENLVYVNGMEIYRPFLVRAGQQEGLSFVNPDLVQGIEFSAGGWQPKYGDKLASVLNITYKTPRQFAASLNAGLLGGTGHLEGASKNGRVSYLLGARYKNGRYLFNTLETRGQYFPRFLDWQGLVNIQLGKRQVGLGRPKTNLSLFTSLAQNRYEVVPEGRQTDFGTFQQALRLFVAFEGREQLSYDTWQTALNLTHHFSEKYQSNWIFSGVGTREREYQNVEGAYRLCDVNTNLASPDFNRCLVTRGIGSLFNYSRNSLQANIFSGETRHEYQASEQSRWAWGLRYVQEGINDQLDEYSFIDSADFVQITTQLATQLDLRSHRLMGYLQHTLYWGKSQTLTYGLRANYWSLNGQTLLAPRVQYAVRPTAWARDISFNLAAGWYQQPPFYRELRGFDGQLNRNLKAQEALHLIGGLDWNFSQWGRPFKFIGEVYYKHLWNVIPYDMDNLRLRYYANNNATGYLTGADFRVSGEFIPGTESWFSLSLLSARERVLGDERGFIRRPTDQRVTFSAFFEDFVPKNPTWRVNLRLQYGSGLPFGPPGAANLRSAFRGPAYRRVDIGFSKIINFAPDEPAAAHQTRRPLALRSLWLGLDVLNLLGVDNTISYLWIRDFSDTVYAVPNGLSQRFLNFRVIGRW